MYLATIIVVVWSSFFVENNHCYIFTATVEQSIAKNEAILENESTEVINPDKVDSKIQICTCSMFDTETSVRNGKERHPT